MTEKLRTEELAKMLDKALANASRAWSPDEVGVKFYAIGEGGTESDAELTAEQIDDLLARAVAKQRVELDIEMLAYEQKSGERNRNSVRVRDESLIAMAATGKGKPCLKDHEHYDSMSVAGRVLWSRGTKVSEGYYQIRMRVRLSAPWAVELALRGLLGAVSISWESLGQIMCTACNAPIRTKCGHWPGMTVSEIEKRDGTKRLEWDPDGAITVEWLYTKAAILEVSLVPIGAVQNAGIDGIRAVLSAAGFSTENEADALEALASLFNESTRPADVPQPALTTEKPPMADLPKLLVVALAAAHYDHYARLAPADAEVFAQKTPAERDAILAAILAADPVVYTTKDGTVIRLSAGELALKQAKQLDAQAEQLTNQQLELGKANELRVTEALRSRITTEFSALAGEASDKLAMLRAVESIADATVKANVLAILKGANAAMTELGIAKGINPGDSQGNPTKETALAALETGLLAFCAEKKIDKPWSEGLAAFQLTPNGKALADAYNATLK